MEVVFKFIDCCLHSKAKKSVGRREEPEEKLAGLVGSTTDGQETSVRLAYIELDIGNS